MKKYIIILSTTLAGVSLLSSCEKKIDSIDTYSVVVDFRNGGAKYVTQDVEVNPKDSVFFDFTISAEEDMEYVEIMKNGNRTDTFRLPASNRRSFSKVVKYQIDSAAGDYYFRIMGRSAIARYLGDGGKAIKVTVKPDFNYWTSRLLYVPDTVAKTNQSFMSANTGELFSYSNGAANSAKIDFGYFYDTTGAASSSTTDDLKHTIFALTSPPPQLGFYDFTSWTKNATIFKKIPTNQNLTTFANAISAGQIRGVAKTVLDAGGTAARITRIALTTTSNISDSYIAFRTAEGKYGLIQAKYFTGDSPAKTNYMYVEVKMVK